MNLLDKLWKPATDIKPEELIGKHCRHKETKEPVIITEVTVNDPYHQPKDYVILIKRSGNYKCPLSAIEFLDESPEAVKELLKEAYCQGFDDGNSYFEIDHEETLRQTAERNFEDHFNH